VVLEREDALACSKVPEEANTLQVSTGEECSVLLERQGVHRASMAFLHEQLLLRLQVPQAPCVVV